jgi:hypothetical protein
VKKYYSNNDNVVDIGLQIKKIPSRKQINKINDEQMTLPMISGSIVTNPCGDSVVGGGVVI